MSDPLSNIHHETFSRIMAEGKLSQGEAYLAAGYNCSSKNAASMGASRLIRNDKIQARICYLQEQAAKLAMLDMAYVLNGLMTNAEKGQETGDLSASNRAYELLGKHLGAFQEAPQQVVNVAVIPQETRAALVAKLLGMRELEEA